ncbi:MAG: XdhC family protein [Burkholderiales bacterium]
MENLDVMVLRSLRDWRLAGRRALLATVVRTWGSSPRPVGSIMALADDGSVVGSVSGGCIEDDLIYRFTRAYAAGPQVGADPGGEAGHDADNEVDLGAGIDTGDDAGQNAGRSAGHDVTAGAASVDDPTVDPVRGLPSDANKSDVAKAIPSGPPAFVKYGVTADEAHRFGLPCGGTLELLLEFDPDAKGLAGLVEALETGRLMQRTVRLADGAASLVEATEPTALALTDEQLVNTFGPEYRMLLIGAGQLTEYLATMALFSGFAVTVCDPRAEYRGGWSVAGVSLSSDMPDDVVLAFKPDRRSCVVALTHDPKLDDLALLEALETEAFYVGAIGSRRNNDARRERMIEHFEQTEQSLAKLRGPIGIYIGSKTPPEIAVSVMAEILAVKNGVALPRDMEVAHAKNARQD